MKLYFSKGNDPRNTTLAYESGQAIYKVDTPFKIAETRVSTISKITPNEHGVLNMQDQFSPLAEIEWHNLASSRIKFGRDVVKTSEFFRKVGFGWRYRQFTGPDGQQYKWKLGSYTSKLYLNDANETPVAEFHRSSLGIIGSRHPAYLEIFPEGEHIMDIIVVTFVYIEKKRKDEERAAAAS